MENLIEEKPNTGNQRTRNPTMENQRIKNLITIATIQRKEENNILSKRRRMSTYNIICAHSSLGLAVSFLLHDSYLS